MLGQPAAEAVAPRARMAVPVAPLYLGVLLLCVTASADRRFSDFKRCADEECSMLLCRGKASQDFTGPDCRFLSFKKGETIYVYYKLSGRRPDLWAGSVGNTFGYFPKDLLNINHIYTEKELEVPAEATDFVCFDTGFDKFETYDVDALLAASALLNRNDDSAAETNHDVENAADELSPSENDHGIKEDLQSLNNDTVDTFESKNDLKEIEGEDPGDFRTEESSQLPSEKETGTLNSKDLRHESEVEKTSESINDKINGVQLTGSTVSDIVEPQKDQATTASSDLQDQTTAASPSLQHHVPASPSDLQDNPTVSPSDRQHQVTTTSSDLQDKPTVPLSDIQHRVTATSSGIQHEETSTPSDLQDKPTVPLSDIQHRVTATSSGIQHEETSTPSDLQDKPAVPLSDIQHRVTATSSGIQHEETSTPSDLQDKPTVPPSDIQHQVTTTSSDLQDKPTVPPSDIQLEETSTPSGIQHQATSTPSDLQDKPTVPPSDIQLEETSTPSGIQHQATSTASDPQDKPVPPSDKQHLATSTPSDLQDKPTVPPSDKQHLATSTPSDLQDKLTVPPSDKQHLATFTPSDLQDKPTVPPSDIHQVTTTSSGIQDQDTAALSDIKDEILNKDDVEEQKTFSEANVVPEMKTKFGSTFDAVISDEEDTWNVTSSDDTEDEDEKKEFEKEPNDEMDNLEETPLLSFSEDNNSHTKTRDVSEDSPSTEESDSHIVLTENQENKSVKMDDTVGTLSDTVLATDDREKAMKKEGDEKESQLEMSESNKKAKVENVLPQSSEFNKEPEEMTHMEENSPDDIISDEHSKPNINSPANDMSNINSQKPLLDEIQDQAELKVFKKLDKISNQPELAVPGTNTENTKSLNEHEGGLSVKTVPEQSLEDVSAGDGVKELETETLPAESSHDHPAEQDLDSEEKANVTHTFNFSEQSKLQDEEPLENASEPDVAVSQKVEMREQVDRVKQEITELFTQTLEKETPDYSKEKKMEADELFNSKEDTTIEQDELLEDENAMLSKASKVEHLESHENTDIGQQENANLQNEEVQSNPEFQKRGVFTGSVEIEKESISPSNTDGSTISASEDGEISKDSASSDAKIDFENFDEVVSSSLEPETENTEMNTEELDIQNELPFSDCEKQLILLGSYFKDHDLKRLYKVLGSWNLLRVESMFTDLDQEMRATKLSHVGTSEELEHSLENILETSETSILDVIEKMLDTRDSKDSDVQESDGTFFDEEAVILDDFQELAFQLRQKYSAASESTPLASEDLLNADSDEISAVGEDTLENLTVTTTESAEPTENLEELQNDSLDSNHDTPHHASERSFEEDGGHFNKNKDIQGTFEDSEDIQRSPQAILENTLDMGFGFEVESPSSGTVDSSSISDYHEEEAQGDSSMSGFVGVGSSLILAQEYLGDYAEMVIAALPEEWKPGPTFYGFPWEPVVATAVVGILTVLVFTWRTVLAVKSRTYQLTEKQLAVRIKQLSDEKSDALTKISQLKKKITENEEKVKESEKCASLSQHENKELKKSFKELQKRNEHFTEKIRTLISAMEEEKRKNQEQAGLITKTEKTVEKFNSIINSNKEELSKFQVLLDEARIREDALKAQVMSFEKENTSLKDQKKSLLCDAKNWEEKHRDLGEKIKVLQKSQKELEDTLAHKENEIEILSDCIAELRQLEVCENANLQEHDTQILANGEAVNKKSDAVKIRIKQMMDVSRVKATLSFVEEERNTYLAKLLAEEKQRHELEEQVKKMEHDRASLNSEKCHLENQFKTIQQKLEIMNEMYQQKENALQQKLTQEKFERLEKENKLSEVDGKALQAEEELKACKRRIQEIEEELQKTERSYKAQIAAHEKKAHENWLNARASERALVEEKRETANLRQKLVEVNDKLAELQRPLFKPTPAHSDRQMQPLRRDDSYGPSPVSGGAPSPPLMIEGPGRSPSAPLGRRNESFGPRPPSDPHGRYSDLRHPLPARPDVYVPRTSSPSTLDGSQSAAVESETQRSAESSSQITEAISSKSQGHPSFLESPIRDVSGPGPSPQPKGHGPLPPNGPPPAVLRPPNGLPPLIPPVPPHPAMGPGPGRFGPTGPPRLYGSVPPPYVRGPLPPPRGYPVGPPAPFGPRDFLPEIRNPMAGPREYPLPSRPLPPGSNPPAAGRDYPGPPPQNVLVATRDFPEGPHPSPAISRDYSPQQGPSRDTSTTSHTEP